MSCAGFSPGASPSGGFRTRSSSWTRSRRRRSASSARRRCASCSRSLRSRRPEALPSHQTASAGHWPETALVTGGASGIGAAAVALLRAEGVDVEVLDLATGFDVGDPSAWERVGPVDYAFLNAGVATGEGDV